MARVETDRVDVMQIFDVRDFINRRDNLSGRMDMAKSSNAYVALFQTRPRGGETHIHQHPDSDQILFILKGQVIVEGLAGQYTLGENQGVLIPAGVHYGFTNATQEDVLFLSMRTESSGGRRIAYVPNVPSNVEVKIPAEEISAKGVGRHLYVYAIDRSTIGISPLLMDEWNRGCLLRMNCLYEKRESQIVAKLPLRMAQWYKIESLSDSDYRLLTQPDKIRVRMDLTPLVQQQAWGPEIQLAPNAAK